MGYNDKKLREEGINKIELHTDNNKFYVSEQEGSYWIDLESFDTYNEADSWLSKRIDKKKKGTFKKKEPLKAIYKCYSYNSDEEYSHAKITSIDPDINFTQCWISFGESFKYRRKDSPPLKDTQANWDALKRIKQTEKDLLALNDSLKHFTSEELQEYFQQ